MSIEEENINGQLTQNNIASNSKIHGKLYKNYLDKNKYPYFIKKKLLQPYKTLPKIS